jgi:hypothetical protein
MNWYNEPFVRSLSKVQFLLWLIVYEQWSIAIAFWYGNFNWNLFSVLILCVEGTWEWRIARIWHARCASLESHFLFYGTRRTVWISRSQTSSSFGKCKIATAKCWSRFHQRWHRYYHDEPIEILRNFVLATTCFSFFSFYFFSCINQLRVSRDTLCFSYSYGLSFLPSWYTINEREG